jgi:hypothetical protein
MTVIGSWIVCLVGLLPAATAQPPRKELPPLKVPDDVIVERDVEYGRAGDRVLRLDVARPKKDSQAARPVLAYIHGGGWRGGNKSMALQNMVNMAHNADYVCFTIGYRLTGEAIWPAQIYDCKAAIRWIKAQAAKYHLDPKKIAVMGHSAGGHLVAFLGTSGDVKTLEGSEGSPGQSSRVPDRDRMLRLSRRRRTGILPRLNLLAPELGQVLLDRIGKAHLPLVHQHHYRSGRNRLRLGGDPEQGVGPHRPLGGQIGIAHRFKAQDLVRRGHQDHRAGQRVVVDQRLDRRSHLRSRQSLELSARDDPRRRQQESHEQAQPARPTDGIILCKRPMCRMHGEFASSCSFPSVSAPGRR